ncbi:response regulator transcription factor [Ramlibacter sp. PS4R-6]|uniref:response regulator transcription factor n=1 Tax=Ramlibacter sp. PS4R-6 TaxID=3133438 RepID=UPI0030A09A64
MSVIRMSAARVYVIAPAMTSWGLERLLQSGHPHIEMTGAARTAGVALAEMAGRPTCLVAIAIDCDADLLELTLLHDSLPSARCLMITGSRDTTLADRAVLAGARGVVKNWEAPEILLKAVEKVNEGELWIDRGATSRLFMEMARQKAAEGRDPEKSKIATLTMRERQAIAAMTRDCAAPAKVIAGRLCISEHTLRNHLTSIYSKLEVCNRLDLYAYAMRHQLAEAA